MCTAKTFFTPVIESIQLLQSLTQACWKESPLRQLPHFTEYMETDAAGRKFNAPDVPSFAKLSQEKRTEFYQKENLTPQQVEDVEAVLSYVPTKVAFDYKFAVEGEDSETIVCGAVVTFFYVVTRDPSVSPLPKINTEPELKKKKILEDDDKKKRIVHAPHFPERRDECWWVVIGDLRGVGNTATLVGINKVGNVDDAAEGRIKFLAPSTEGNYTFVAHLLCDGYIGFDKKVEFRIRVVKDELAEKEKLAQLEREKKKKADKEARAKGKPVEGGDESSSDDSSFDDYDDDEDEDDIPELE